jgi:hypothetical protein
VVPVTMDRSCRPAARRSRAQGSSRAITRSWSGKCLRHQRKPAGPEFRRSPWDRCEETSQSETARRIRPYGVGARLHGGLHYSRPPRIGATLKSRQHGQSEHVLSRPGPELCHRSHTQKCSAARRCDRSAQARAVHGCYVRHVRRLSVRCRRSVASVRERCVVDGASAVLLLPRGTGSGRTHPRRGMETAAAAALCRTGVPTRTCRQSGVSPQLRIAYARRLTAIDSGDGQLRVLPSCQVALWAVR